MRRSSTWAKSALMAGLSVVSATTLIVGISACSSGNDPSDPKINGKDPVGTSDGFSAFDVGANDPTMFYSAIDAVPMNDGSLVFLARASNSAPVAPVGDDSQITAARGDRTTLFVQRPGQKPQALYSNFVLALSLATDGENTIYVADWGAESIVTVSASGGAASSVNPGIAPKGVAVGKDGSVYMTARDGVYRLTGDQANVVAQGGMTNLSGIDVAANGDIYVASASDGLHVPDEKRIGGGTGAIYRIRGNAVQLLSAGFHAAEPTGIALVGGRLAVSTYEGYGESSAVHLYDIQADKLEPVVYSNDALAAINVSGGLHRNVKTNQLAWSGGSTVFAIKP